MHFVWIDGAYNMVKFSQIAKYGRAAAVEFGPVDLARYAEDLAPRGFMIETPEEITPVLGKAIEIDGPVLIGIPVDYRDNGSSWSSSIPARSIDGAREDMNLRRDGEIAIVTGGLSGIGAAIGCPRKRADPR